MENSLGCIWHPYVQMKTEPAPFKVKSGKGVMLELENGKQLIDGISSWWLTVHGHCDPKIAEAIYKQALQLEQVIFANYTHEPAEKFAQMLLKQLPSNLTKVFYSDNGSTAVEIALKQAYQYWINRGQKRSSFLCFQGGYHGDTFGAMSVAERSVFTAKFKDLLFDVAIVPSPFSCPDNLDRDLLEDKALTWLDEELSKNPEQYAALIVEPLVQGANGMQMCSVEFLQKLEKKLKDYGVLLIYDEAMTGFGRTGDWFACVKSNTSPDIICLAKGISGGFLPLAVTVCSEDIFRAFYSNDRSKAFLHGHSYMANPLGCAAAIASMELLLENESQFKKMEERYAPYIPALKMHSKLKNVRQCGTIVAMDVITSDAEGYLNEVGRKLRVLLEKEGLLTRPIGNILYLMPPYCITDEQIDMMYNAVYKALDHL